MNVSRSFSLLLPLFVAPLAGCPSATKDAGDTDATDTDVADTDVPDTDVIDTDVEDTDVPDVCGDGTPAANQLCFEEPVGYDGEGTITALEIADWNGGGADIVFGNGSSVYTYDGDGAGLFVSGTLVSSDGVGTTVREIKAGHMDADANVDLAVGGDGTNGSVLFGDGDGAVSYSGYLTGEGSMQHVYVADLVGSGPTDDVLTSSAGCGGLVQTSGTADAAWRADYDYLCQPNTGVIARTGAGHSSLVSIESTTLEVTVVSATTTAFTLGEPTTYTLPAAASDMDTADLDGDGDEDVLALLTDGTLKVLFSDGADGWEGPTSEPWVSYTAPGGATDVEVGDLDGDGDVDVALAATTDDAIVVLLNDGAGTLMPLPIALASGAAPTRIALGDVNSDGVPDIAVAVALAQPVLVLLSKP